MLRKWSSIKVCWAKTMDNIHPCDAVGAGFDNHLPNNIWSTINFATFNGFWRFWHRSIRLVESFRSFWPAVRQLPSTISTRHVSVVINHFSHPCNSCHQPFQRAMRRLWSTILVSHAAINIYFEGSSVFCRFSLFATKMIPQPWTLQPVFVGWLIVQSGSHSVTWICCPFFAQI